MKPQLPFYGGKVIGAFVFIVFMASVHALVAARIQRKLDFGFVLLHLRRASGISYLSRAKILNKILNRDTPATQATFVPTAQMTSHALSVKS